MNTQEIGKRIREKRLEKSWSMMDLAEKVNLSVTYIGMIERGDTFPRLETFIKLANILEVSADELLVDVLQHGSKESVMSRYADKISKLDEKEKWRLYGILDAFLGNDWYRRFVSFWFKMRL